MTADCHNKNCGCTVAVCCEVLPGSHGSTSLLRYRYAATVDLIPGLQIARMAFQVYRLMYIIYIGMRRIAPGQSFGRLVDGFVTEAQHHFAVSQALHETPRFDPRHWSHIGAVHAEELVPGKKLTTLFSAASWEQ